MTVVVEAPALPDARTTESTPESARVAELQEMIRSGRYAGYLDELRGELEKAKAARAELAALTATGIRAGAPAFMPGVKARAGKAAKARAVP